MGSKSGCSALGEADLKVERSHKQNSHWGPDRLRNFGKQPGSKLIRCGRFFAQPANCLKSDKLSTLFPIPHSVQNVRVGMRDPDFSSGQYRHASISSQ